MPQDKRRFTLSQSLWTQNPELFSLEALSTSVGLEAASLYLQTASSTSSSPTSVLNSATTYLLTLDPCTFPLLLSCETNDIPSSDLLTSDLFTDDATLNQEFSEALSTTFPTTAKGFVDSNAQKLLEYLKIFYHSIPPEENDIETLKLDAIHPRLHRITPALAIISQSTFDSTPTLSPEPRSPKSPSVDEGDEIPFLRKQRKKKSRGASIVIDDGAFLGIGVRRTSRTGSVRRTERNLESEHYLQVFITSSLTPNIQTYMRCLLRPVSHKHASKLLSVRLSPVSPATIPGRSASSLRDDNKLAQHNVTPQSPPLTGYVPSNPVQAIQLLEEDVKDFGAWKILLSGESMRHLRQIRRSDRHMFDIVKNTIK
jgi:hypothetical protein